MSSAKKQTAKATFEIKKGTRQVMTLSEAEVEKYLDLQALLPAWRPGMQITVKIVNVFDGNVDIAICRII